MDENLRNRQKYAIWPKLRKWTVPIHWGLGFALAWLAWQCFPAAIILLLIFAGWEIWNDWAEKSRMGFLDWHECFLTFCIGFFGVILILHCEGIITIRWWF